MAKQSANHKATEAEASAACVAIETNFCSHCDTLLPLPNFDAGYVLCAKCHTRHTTNEEIVDRLVYHTHVSYVKARQETNAEKKDEAVGNDGPEVRFACCSENIMSKSTTMRISSRTRYIFTLSVLAH